MVARRILDYVVRQTGAKLIPAGYRAFRKYDIQTTNQLFGKSGGKGFRHGRDLGLILGEYVGGDDLGDELQAPENDVPSPFRKTRRGRQRNYNRRNACYHRCNQYGRSSNKFRK